MRTSKMCLCAGVPVLAQIENTTSSSVFDIFMLNIWIINSHRLHSMSVSDRRARDRLRQYNRLISRAGAGVDVWGQRWPECVRRRKQWPRVEENWSQIQKLLSWSQLLSFDGISICSKRCRTRSEKQSKSRKTTAAREASRREKNKAYTDDTHECVAHTRKCRIQSSEATITLARTHSRSYDFIIFRFDTNPIQTSTNLLWQHSVRTCEKRTHTLTRAKRRAK